MKDETLDDERVERAEETMRKWVNLSDEEFSEQMFDPHGRELDLPYHGGVRDEELLRKFIQKAEKMDKGDGYHEDMSRCRLKFLTWPEDGEWVVPEEEIEEIMSLNTPSWLNGNKENNLLKWKRVYNEYSVGEMRFISETIKIKDGYKGRDPKSSVVVDVFRFIKGDDSVSLEDYFELVNETENGPDKEVVLNKLGKAVRTIDPALSATTLCGLYELSIDGERCGDFDGICNSRGIIDIKVEDIDAESSTIHEFCHGIFYMLSVTEESSHPNLEFRKEDTGEEVGILKTPQTHPSQIKKFFNEIEREWDSLTENMFEVSEDYLGVCREEMDDEEWNKLVKEADEDEFDEVIGEALNICRTYQTKNFDEFLAVSLSQWVCNPNKLKECQPEVYDIIENYIANLNEGELETSEKEEFQKKVPA